MAWLLLALGFCLAAEALNCTYGHEAQCPSDKTGLMQIAQNRAAQWPSRSTVNPSFGALLPDETFGEMPGKLRVIPPAALNISIPERFDAREAWPQCRNVIGHARDQGNCASCWAVGTVSTFNDRYCIATNDSTTIFSAYDVLVHCNVTSVPGKIQTQCVNPAGGGCFGGLMPFAWETLKTYGVVTGGGYNSKEGCAPYPFLPCHDPANRDDSRCSPENMKTPPEFSSCPNANFQGSFLQDKLYASDWYYLPNNNIRAIQIEIMQRGTVSCSVKATCSMLNYTGGVYIPSGKTCGGHIMNIIGWGSEDGKDYWLVRNSWGPRWGLDGFIKWIRGINAQNIEEGAAAGIYSAST